MMFVALWKYKVKPGFNSEFEQLYGNQGEWVKLFRKAPAYQMTELLYNGDSEYVSIDRWNSRSAYEAFYTTNKTEIERIDTLGDALTETETKLGWYESL